MNINQVWPEWHEDCVLGEGSFGKVYRAKRVEYGRTFYSAIKVLTVPKSQQEIKFARSQGMNDNEIYNYFRGVVDNLLNEITLMDNLKGAQNIVGIEDYKIIEHEGEIGWDIFIRMELLTPFDSFITSSDFSQKDVIKLGVDICTALESCEQNYIIHRDIKPDNIFISRFGEFKLGDFGIARKLETTQANLSRKGTLNYMAPEVYKSEEYGSNVDIYSLGLVLYTLLNNNRIAFLPPYPQPITYKDNEEALSKRLSGQPVPPPCNASYSLGAVITKACAYNPWERYQTATEFKNALINEWNFLVQSGDNRGIKPEVIHYNTDIDTNLRNTTKDMTANGRIVVNEFSDNTSFLNNGEYDYTYQQVQYADNTADYDYSGYKVPDADSYHKKTNKLSKYLSVAMATITAVLGLILTGTASVSQGLTILVLSAIILLCNKNNRALGIALTALALPSVFESGADLFQVFDLSNLLSLLSALLMLFAGVSVTFQKEARFGGSLCIYSLAITWLFNIYLIMNNEYVFNIIQLFTSLAALSVVIWSFGFNSKNTSQKNNVLNLVTLIMSIAALVQAAANILINI